MWLSRQALFLLAKAFYRPSFRRERSMMSPDAYDSFRGDKIEFILNAAQQYGIHIDGKSIMDLGCANGAITHRYLDKGAKTVTGVDISATDIEAAKKLYARQGLNFILNDNDSIPMDDASVDIVFSYDVFEHVLNPDATLKEVYRVLRPGGSALLGLQTWYHPFAPHLWATMPVPWAHVFFSEETVMAACRRVYTAYWYFPTKSDFDAKGKHRADRYTEKSIGDNYLNKMLIRDFEKMMATNEIPVRTYVVPFKSMYLRFTKFFLKIPCLREFFASYTWFVITKPNTFAVTQQPAIPKFQTIPGERVAERAHLSN